jgi:hypothetical protein
MHGLNARVANKLRARASRAKTQLKPNAYLVIRD